MTEICSLSQLRDYYGDVSELAARKELDHLDRHARAFIARSPFVVMATADANGWPDASPKGDAPGFVTVEDEHRLLLPDRPGNNRVDGFNNLMTNAKVGLIFFVPQIDHTLRVNGTARLLTDEATCGRFAVNRKPARAVLEVTATQVFFHCGKALIRSRLWKAENWQPATGIASLGAALADQVGTISASDADARIEDSNRNRLY